MYGADRVGNTYLVVVTSHLETMRLVTPSSAPDLGMFSSHCTTNTLISSCRATLYTLYLYVRPERCTQVNTYTELSQCSALKTLSTESPHRNTIHFLIITTKTNSLKSRDQETLYTASVTVSIMCKVLTVVRE